MWLVTLFESYDDARTWRRQIVISLLQVPLKSGPLSGLILLYRANQAYIASFEMF
jgi:hypothetical protein